MNDIVRARVNSDVKQQAEEILKAHGLCLSVAIRMLLTKIAREKEFKL
jgi:addiction module RelB/DinJ family antitoxin